MRLVLPITTTKVLRGEYRVVVHGSFYSERFRYGHWVDNEPAYTHGGGTEWHVSKGAAYAAVRHAFRRLVEHNKDKKIRVFHDEFTQVEEYKPSV